MKQFSYNNKIYNAYKAGEMGIRKLSEYSHIEEADTGFVPRMRQKDIVKAILKANGYTDYFFAGKNTHKLIDILIDKLGEASAVTSATGPVFPSGGSYGVFIVFQQPPRYKEEKERGRIEAPKRDKSGSKIPHHWRKLVEVNDSDIIFHMSNQTIKAVSVAKGTIYSSDEDNNAVNCEYHEFDTPIDLRFFRNELKNACKDVPNAPFRQEDGKGNQGYLYDLPVELTRLFIEQAKKLNPAMDLEFLNNIERQTSLDSEKNTGGNNMRTEETKLGLNMILYGPPGTGKTYNTKKYAVAICENKNLSEYETVPYSTIEEKYNAFVSEKRIAFTTFHQSYGYEDFIEGIKPRTNNENNQVEYPVVQGVFSSFCDAAQKKEVANKPCVFIIDEINRGNVSKIFGELITLIEPTKRLGSEEAMVAKLPYSRKDFGVPNNVYILGTMNTADRSIAIMDTALRRRFSFIEMMPDSSVLNKIGADKVYYNGKNLDVVALLNKINERIGVLYDREHTIGHAFFTCLTGEKATLKTLKSIFENKVIPLLQEYFYEDYEKIQMVLGDNYKSNDKFKFVISEVNNTKSIFKGYVDDSNIPEKKYKINKEALDYFESYLEIL